MKKCLFAFSLIIFMASLGLAMTTGYQTAQAPQKAMKTITGEVVSVDAAKSEVAVKDDTGAEVRLATNKSTKVTKEGKAAALTDLKPGDKVTCEAEEASGGWLAKSIKVSSVKSDQ